MAGLKALSDEMAKLKKQIGATISISGYRDYDDLSGLDAGTADDRQRREEYCKIVQKLDEVQRILDYLEKPIREESRIYTNESGRYETDNGHYYTCGSGIEFLRTEEVLNNNNDEWEDVEIWTCSSVESKDGQYYIVGYPDLEMSGLKVRIRE